MSHNAEHDHGSDRNASSPDVLDRLREDFSRRLSGFVQAGNSLVGAASEKPYQDMQSAVRALFRILMPGAETMHPNERAPNMPGNDGSGWRVQMAAKAMQFRQEQKSRAIEAVSPFSLLIVGPSRSSKLHEPGSEHRKKALNRDHRDRKSDDIAPFLPPFGVLLGGLRKAVHEQDRVRREMLAALKQFAAADRRKRLQEARENLRALNKLGQHMDDQQRQSAARWANDARLSESRAQERLRMQARAITAAAGIAMARSRRQALDIHKARAEQPQQQAHLRVRKTVAALRAIAESGVERAKGTAIDAGVRRQEASRRVDATRTHGSHIFTQWSKTDAKQGGFSTGLRYLARLRDGDAEMAADPEVATAMKSAMHRAAGRVSADSRQSAAAEEVADGRSLREAIAPAKPRWILRLQAAQERDAAARMPPAPGEASYGPEPMPRPMTPSADRRRAEQYSHRAHAHLMDNCKWAMKGQKTRNKIGTEGVLKARRIQGGQGAAMIYCPFKDETDPIKINDAFHNGGPRPLRTAGQMGVRTETDADGNIKIVQGEQRYRHLIVSLPKTDLPEGITPDQALLDRVVAQAMALGLDPRRHRMIVFRHEDDIDGSDDGCLHAHAMIDRVRDDGKVHSLDSLDAVVVNNAVSNLFAGLYLDTHGEDGRSEPIFAAPVFSNDGMHQAGMEAMRLLAKGKLTCRFLGEDAVDTEEQELLSYGALVDMLTASGRDGILPAFAKLDDRVWTTAYEEIAEKTLNDPKWVNHWRYLPEEERHVRMWEHFWRLVAKRAKAG
jgi:hypothetical protein